MRTVDIFIKSYHKDFWLLRYALLSIRKFVTGYNTVHLVIPAGEYPALCAQVKDEDFPERTVIHQVNERTPGWLWQQYLKLRAFEYCNADFVMFGDSDCIHDHIINLQDFIVDGKPEILYTDWNKVGDAIIWKKPTEEFLRDEVPFEGMRRNNMIFHWSTLVNISRFRPDLQELVMGSEKFSEFNAMSAFAYKFEREKYNFVDTDHWTYTRPKAIQLWSHASKSSDSATHKEEWKRTTDTIVSIFGKDIINEKIN